MSGHSKEDSGSNCQNKDGIIDGAFTLKGVYGFLKEVPVWILSGAVLIITLIQVLWMAGGKLDLAMQVIQVVDRSTLLLMAIYQMLYIASFYVQLGGPGYFVWRLVSRLDEEKNRGVEEDRGIDAKAAIRVIALLTICMDSALFFVASWVMFIFALFVQISIFFSYHNWFKKRLNGKNNEIGYGWIIDNLKRFFEGGESIVVSMGLAVIIVASLTSGSWFASQNITYRNESQQTSSSVVGEVLGENSRGIIILKEGRVLQLKKDAIINEEFCKPRSRFVDDNETLYTKIWGSNIPDCRLGGRD